METTDRARELHSEITRIRAENNKFRAENSLLRSELDTSREQALNLEKIIAELKAALEKALSQSFTAPSTPSGQKPTFAKSSKPRGARRRKPGRKAGHPGSHRERPETIDRIEPHTLDSCPHCGRPVKELRSAGGGPAFRCRTVEDIVLGAMEAIEHRLHQYWCHGCGTRVEPPVATALTSARLGLNLVATTAVQHYLYGVPVAKAVRMLEQQHGLRVTPGALLQHWHRLAEYLRFQYEFVLTAVQVAGVLHADETGWRVGGRNWWLWCFATKTHVLYLPDGSRGGKVPLAVLGKLFDGILVTDFYAACNACLARGSQYCLAHLLREFERCGPGAAAACPRSIWNSKGG